MAIPLFAPRRATLEPRPANARGPAIVGARAAVHARGREVAALGLWSLALFATLALLSYRTDVHGAAIGGNWVGPVGAALAQAIVSTLGVVGWCIPVEAALLGVPFVRGKDSLITPQRVAGDLLIALIATALVQVAWPGATAFGASAASGAVGELFGELMRSLFSTIGSFLVGFSLLGLILIARATFSFIALMHAVGRLSQRSAEGTAKGARTAFDAWKTARTIEHDKRELERVQSLPPIVRADDMASIALACGDDEGARTSDNPEPALLTAPDTIDIDEACTAALTREAPEEKPLKRRRPKRATVDADLAPPPPPESEQDAEPEPDATEADLAPEAEESAPEPKAKRVRPAKEKLPVVEIVDTSAALEKELPVARPTRMRSGFVLPSLDFLVPAGPEATVAIDEELLRKNAELLVKTLADYGVTGKVEAVLPGPTVTTYEVSTASGTKVSKVAGLADDLALAMARKVRIVAPIPGKNRIGFELPNEKRIPVNLRDLVEDGRFQALTVPLPVVLGRDIQGHPVYADLAAMPHVIVAGATGAGKSVGLNVMLTSLLYRRSPQELRLLMIDPKVVELAPFDRIPHMLLPVVTDMKQAATALKWAVDEMERRYQLFADAGTKNVGTYNNWVERVCRGEVNNPFPKRVIGKDHNGFSDDVKPGEGEEGEAPLPEKMPFIVIVVDEFADLMMQQGKEVETAVARLAQKARAAGMHVILATQRPSVDVITGMIKANFPTRIAFRVAQKVDSRTILDEQGAEHLLGRGDMLIKLNGTNDTKRVQCPMVSEEEVQAVTDHLRAQGEPVYDENILKPRDEDGGDDDDAEMDKDSMYDEAVRIVAETRRCSTSWLQRKLGLGYNRAARIVEMMERQGVVGPANGSKDREVLVSTF